MRMPIHMLPAVALTAIAVGGCGGGGATKPTPAHASASAPARRPASPCARMAAAAGSGARARVVSHESELVTCQYTSSGSALRVMVDTAPQAWLRWQRAQVERTQTTREWANIPAQQPHLVSGVGGGAFWVPGPRELVASDGQRLLTVRVLRPKKGGAARRDAIRVARAGLGPVKLPPAPGT
jgi:hypothetical protein